MSFKTVTLEGAGLGLLWPPSTRVPAQVRGCSVTTEPAHAPQKSEVDTGPRTRLTGELRRATALS